MILIGEIRDEETAKTAVQAALTGHLVLSTIHAGSAAGAARRLIEMGIPAYEAADALCACVFQCLVRTICPACHGAGCAYCRSSGYSGRSPVFEVMPIHAEMAQCLRSGGSADALWKLAVQAGARSIGAYGEELIAMKRTDRKEMERVRRR